MKAKTVTTWQLGTHNSQDCSLGGYDDCGTKNRNKEEGELACGREIFNTLSLSRYWDIQMDDNR